jgi:Fe-S cluster assembly protein SufD
MDADHREQYASDFVRFEKTAPGRKSWLPGIRKAALQSFSELGFPTTRHEEWRYTNVSPIARTRFHPASPYRSGLAAADFSGFTFGGVECCQLVFVDGHFSETLSMFGQLPRGARVRNLAGSLSSDRNRVEPHLARYARIEDNAFAALNTAFMRDGAFIFLPAGTILRDVIHVLHLSTVGMEPTVSYPRTLIVAGEGSQAGIVETHAAIGEGVYFTNSVTEVVAGPGAVIDHYRLQRESDAAYHYSMLQVSQAADSSFTSYSISIGGALVRNDIEAVFGSPGGDCTLNGLYVTRGLQHVDNHTSIIHAKPNCTSRELYKGILDETSTGVFNGRIVVAKDAQKTNAKQTNKNLLLSEGALVNTKPQLEIFADDVKCTHGATIGRLNEDELFYLRSRGIGEQLARTLLTYAFASDVVGAVKIKPIQCQVDLVLLNRLSRSSAIADYGFRNGD